MTMTVSQTAYAVGPSISAYFLGQGGQEPYSYAVSAGGAGGTINSSTGYYLAPEVVPSDPRNMYDTIVVTDDNGNTLTARIMIGGPLQLLMEIVQRVMSLPNGRIYLYNQKILQPSDADLYIAVRTETSHNFGNSNSPAVTNDGVDSDQFVSMIDTISFDLISRSTEALRRRGEFLRVFNSGYCQNQQLLNGIYIARDPVRPFVSIPDLDGADIPYRFRVSYLIQYPDKLSEPAAFYDDFEDPTVLVNP